jgi:hypothetical protein
MPNRPRFALLLTPTLLAMGGLGCSADKPDLGGKPVPASTAGCVTTGDGELRADLRGSIDTDLLWSNVDMQCDGSIRPDGKGLRVTIAGRWHGKLGAAAAADHQLRFIFGVDLVDQAPGAATVFPTNLTVIIEGEQTLFATHGDSSCAVETLQRTPLQTTGKRDERVKVRGYCLGPAESADGTARLLVPTFDFTGVVRHGESA